METSFKNWLCPNFLSLPKKSEFPKLWEGCSPPRPPGPYAYAYYRDVYAIEVRNTVSSLIGTTKETVESVRIPDMSML